jgi:hypothetical protein
VLLYSAESLFPFKFSGPERAQNPFSYALILPLDEPLNPVTLRNHLLKVAERTEEALGEEQASFIEGRPRDWGRLPIPDGPLTVGLDGAYVRAQHKQGGFKVIAGKSVLEFKRDDLSEERSSKCFAFVQTYDEKPRRRLFELLRSQGMQENQQVVFLSDGGEDVRSLPLYLNPESEHWLDWFHIAMRLTALQQTAKGLPLETGEGDEARSLREAILKSLESTKWYLWHGNVYQALQHLEWVEMDLDAAGFERDDEVIAKLFKAVEEFHTYIRNGRNQSSAPVLIRLPGGVAIRLGQPSRRADRAGRSPAECDTAETPPTPR